MVHGLWFWILYIYLYHYCKAILPFHFHFFKVLLDGFRGRKVESKCLHSLISNWKTTVLTWRYNLDIESNTRKQITVLCIKNILYIHNILLRVLISVITEVILWNGKYVYNSEIFIMGLNYFAKLVKKSMKIIPFWRKTKRQVSVVLVASWDWGSKPLTRHPAAKHEMPFYSDLIAFHQNVPIADLTGNYLPSWSKCKSCREGALWSPRLEATRIGWN